MLGQGVPLFVLGRYHVSFLCVSCCYYCYYYSCGRIRVPLVCDHIVSGEVNSRHHLLSC